MKKLKDNWIVDLSVTTILLGLMCYAAYSLWYIFDGTLSSGDVHLYTALTSISLGWFMMIFTKTIFKKANWIVKLITFLAGCGLLIGGLLSYSLLFYFNPVWWLSGFILLSGIQGTNRIIYHQHSLLEVILGFIVGMFCGIIGILFI